MFNIKYVATIGEYNKVVTDNHIYYVKRTIFERLTKNLCHTSLTCMAETIYHIKQERFVKLGGESIIDIFETYLFQKTAPLTQQSAHYKTVDCEMLYADDYIGAVYRTDGMWYPFCYTRSGKDVLERGFDTALAAYYAAQKMFV